MKSEECDVVLKKWQMLESFVSSVKQISKAFGNMEMWKILEKAICEERLAITKATVTTSIDDAWFGQHFLTTQGAFQSLYSPWLMGNLQLQKDKKVLLRCRNVRRSFRHRWMALHAISFKFQVQEWRNDSRVEAFDKLLHKNSSKRQMPEYTLWTYFSLNFKMESEMLSQSTVARSALKVGFVRMFC